MGIAGLKLVEKSKDFQEHYGFNYKPFLKEYIFCSLAGPFFLLIGLFAYFSENE